ncbi:hypothetical protein CBR_g37808 [Chara braunii]|uniref:Cyclic nucleotide-binding domain-containing protein n=1 Tax=Chara braunii TaxID=69332 RepID=A0A388LNL1_CHABU|nr:hypothetical protein CBR_g37808 [Chara braunii]|eukprot:GBG83936.1 hypothetical protein CBR_g37808 [Chara braunii]
MNRVFHDYLDKFVIVYLGDILIFSRTVEEHVAHLDKVLSLLRQYEFKINGEKCEFGRTRILYLGHEISAEGLKLDDVKVANIHDWPRPQSVTEMTSFLGMTGQYRNFVKNYSIVAAPLTDLTRLDTPWEWTDRCEAAFRHLKHALTHHEVLKLPDPDKSFIVTTDASQYGIGAVLAQQEGPKLRPVEYMSKKMPSQKLAKSNYEKDLYVIYKALTHWRHYLLRRFFIVRTDHQTLKWMRTQPMLFDALKRWIEVIEQYDFEPQYLKGEYNKLLMPCHLPIYIQKQLIKSLEYQWRPKGTIIIRQGEPAGDWYIILTGSVSIFKLDDKENANVEEGYYGNFVTELVTGDSFGEAVPSAPSSNRAATVKSNDKLCLACCRREDYLRTVYRLDEGQNVAKILHEKVTKEFPLGLYGTVDTYDCLETSSVQSAHGKQQDQQREGEWHSSGAFSPIISKMPTQLNSGMMWRPWRTVTAISYSVLAGPGIPAELLAASVAQLLSSGILNGDSDLEAKAFTMDLDRFYRSDYSEDDMEEWQEDGVTSKSAFSMDLGTSGSIGEYQIDDATTKTQQDPPDEPTSAMEDLDQDPS